MSPEQPRRHLVLASTSRYRAQLLERLRVDFTQDSPEFDERVHDPLFERLDADDFAVMLAEGKARSLRSRYPLDWILAADQIGVLSDEYGGRTMLRKAPNEESAVEQLTAMSATTHELFTGVVLLDCISGQVCSAVERHRVTMRRFNQDEARDYVRRFRPFDTAGSYRIEDSLNGVGLVKRVESRDETGIVGLPLATVARMLREAGILPDSS